MSSSELLCYICITNYAKRVTNTAPRSASAIYNGYSLCWKHFAERAGIDKLLKIDVDDLVRPTGYSVLRISKEKKDNNKKQKEEEEEEK